MKLPRRPEKFAEAAHEATRADPLICAGIAALLEALAAIDAQVARRNKELQERARRSLGD